jgi:RNA polymerase sigma-70 factor (ECF subfamily)
MNLEKDLLVRLKNADENAFREVFDSYFKKVHQFVNRYVKEPAQSEDITQTIFIKLWDKKADLDISKSFDGYIFTIAYRMVMDYFRQTKLTHQYITTDRSAGESIASSITSDELLNSHQLESIYARALKTLPSKRKEIFLLSRHHGLSNKQIADHLQISVKTVENQMTAALSRLREYFTRSDIDSVILIIIFSGSIGVGS